ncbi:hypothetical protein Pint_32666 [Pistacia integerrima]|uniref:Uncharacterized protein n=1 Tax=Pistacia integerrima TaxID=434235 RepID=A0ACC0XMZ5_9ROSI|nr:hypothetical protein Pint_32666 [Pistacia integerrima]
MVMILKDLIGVSKFNLFWLQHSGKWPKPARRDMEEQGQKCRRVVLVPCPYQGHIQAM